MSEPIEFEYRGEKIFYNEPREVWTWRSPVDQKESAALKPIRAAIDAFCKNEWNGVKAYIADWRLISCKEAPVVAIVGRAPNGDFWIKGKRGAREQVKASTVIAITPENEAILLQITVDIPTKQQAIYDETEALMNSLKRLVFE